MYPKEIIHISVASNNNYAVLTAALIKSVICNHLSGELLVFYIISDKISKINKTKINTLSSAEIQIKWIEADKILPEKVHFPLDNSSYPSTTFLRLLSPYVLSEDVKRLIYLDVDMIVLGDVSELWNLDLKGYPIAAVVDIVKVVSCSWGGIANYKQLGLAPETRYFNAGLMVIDVKQWIDNEIPKKVLKLMNENLEFVTCADQYGLNVIFAQKWLEIDPLWNWFAHNYHPNPKNIHFLEIKPIFKSYKYDKSFQKEFFKYLNMTPWIDMPLKGDYLRLFNKAYTKIRKKVMKVILSK
jgi:lipopolysaccharide biosynthesis glycosyltransferase